MEPINWPRWQSTVKQKQKKKKQKTKKQKKKSKKYKLRKHINIDCHHAQLMVSMVYLKKDIFGNMVY